MTALARWREQLEGWAIPETILAAAPVSPWGFSVDMFRRRAEAEAALETPTRARCRAALGKGGSVLDVGCGAGAGSLALVPAVTAVIGVDASAGMLASFAERADALGLPHQEVEGTWPEVADDVAPADLVVVAHVLHNVPDLAPFATALTERARRRVVVELTDDHPLGWTRPYWMRFHGLERPEGPDAADAVAALRELGLDVALERWDAPTFLAGADRAESVAFLRQRLCLPAARDGEIGEAIDELGLPTRRRLATAWWNGSIGSSDVSRET